MKIQDILGHCLGVLVIAIEDRFEALNVHIAQLIHPETVDGRRHQRKIVLLETTVTVVDGNRQPAENPAIHHCLPS